MVASDDLNQETRRKGRVGSSIVRVKYRREGLIPFCISKVTQNHCESVNATKARKIKGISFQIDAQSECDKLATFGVLTVQP